MRSRWVSKGNHRAAGGSQTGQGGPQYCFKGKQKGGKSTQGGAGGPWSFRRVAKGTGISEFDDCYTVS